MSIETPDPEIRRAELRATLGRLSRTGELPTLPSVATSALSIARDPEADVDRLCRAIQTDIGIAARVLRVANSAIYGRRTVCKSLRDAVTTVGMRTMQDILSAAALRSLLDLKNPVAQRLWDHSLAVAIAAEEVGRATGRIRHGGAFLPALFHDVGRIVFFLSDPVGYDEVLRFEVDDHSAAELGRTEREWYGFDHAEAGAALAADWGLPADFCDAIRWHHDPSQATTGSALAHLIAAADFVVYRIGLGACAGDAEARAAHAEGLDMDDESFTTQVRDSFASERAVYQ